MAHFVCIVSATRVEWKIGQSGNSSTSVISGPAVS